MCNELLYLTIIEFLDDSNILDHYLFIVTLNENDHIMRTYIYSSSAHQHIVK